MFSNEKFRLLTGTAITAAAHERGKTRYETLGSLSHRDCWRPMTLRSTRNR